MMLQDLSPSRVVAASSRHARALVASKNHLPMAMAGPWTMRVPTHGRCHAHVVRCHATARVVDASYVWMMLQDLSASRVVAASAGHARAVVASTSLPTYPWLWLVLGPCAYPLMDGVKLTSYGVHATAKAVHAS